MNNLKKDLPKRLLSSFFLISLIAVMLTFAYAKYFAIVVILSIAFLAVVATFELINICKKKVNLFSKLTLIFSPLIVLSFFPLAINPEFINFPVILSFLYLILVFLKHFSNVKNSIVDISVSLFIFIYVSVPLGMLVYILYATELFTSVDGREWVFIILLLSKTSDIFGYFVGKLFGKNKMIERVSPQKTREGSIAGVIATILVALAIQYFFNDSFVSYTNAVVLGLITAILSQIGDLSESLLKRDASVKDSSKIPGIGGILDSLDSLLFTIPFYYIWLNSLI